MHERLTEDHLLPAPASALPRRAGARPRVVILEDDAELLQLLCDLLGDDYDIAAPDGPIGIPGIEAGEPDAIVIGTLSGRASGTLAPDEIVTLARRHMRLHRVPIVLLTAQPDALTRAGRLTPLWGVTVVPLPFEAETLWAVLATLTADAAPVAEIGLP